ncbi:pyridoxamine 5'-phosphate oxidase family protein [Pararhizobium sp.]|uniref:pyridoxamine 5'-phosphate oxidase family protein n=1 Tax=Pararhizobium sp. TaxID=1977563 RepID=UPI002715FE0F|nr:pyridoxamine 5'-phosphate oxidase family protein [Pararhizobium sp.]MDO9415287.1 pyridoxamine 5'-phosphate oxidase family protein [Pararhizobium sp.]
MSGKSLSELSRKMRDIDIAMLATHTDGGAIAGRPMSNNGEVDYDGDSYYFTWEKSRMVADIERDAKVSLTFQGAKAFMVAVEGEAEVIRDKAAFKKHWTPDLDQWFEDGVDTKGVVMINVRATRIHYWDGEEDGEVKLKGGSKRAH